MALFIDIHTLEEGVDAAAAAEAHEADLETQGKYGVSYLRYWINDTGNKIFCLVEADTADDAVAVHREAHGLVADEIYAVSEHR